MTVEYLTGTSTITVQYFSSKSLMKALKKAGLPCTYKTILKYEKMGVIKRPGIIVTGSDNRLYTKDQIDEIIKVVREHKRKEV